MLRRLLHKIVPPENSLPLAITGLMNLIAFSGPKLLQVLGWSLPMHDMTAAFDRAFPFSPVWVFVYVAAFPFWIYQYSVVAKESRSLCYRLVAADFAAKVICLLFFVLLPTHNVRPPLETGGFTGWAMRTIWLLDTPTNLFPSIHCLVSWMCFIGIRGNKRVPRWYRIFSCIFALLVVVSTQVTKQHYLIDAIGGILLAEVLYAWNKRSNAYLYVKGFFERVNASLRSLSRKKKGGYA